MKNGWQVNNRGELGILSGLRVTHKDNVDSEIVYNEEGVFHYIKDELISSITPVPGGHKITFHKEGKSHINTFDENRIIVGKVHET